MEREGGSSKGVISRQGAGPEANGMGAEECDVVIYVTCWGARELLTIEAL